MKKLVINVILLHIILIFNIKVHSQTHEDMWAKSQFLQQQTMDRTMFIKGAGSCESDYWGWVRNTQLNSPQSDAIGNLVIEAVLSINTFKDKVNYYPPNELYEMCNFFSVKSSSHG